MTITDEQKPYDTRINVDCKTYNSRLHSLTVKEGRGSLVPNESAPCEHDIRIIQIQLFIIFGSAVF